MTDHQGMTQVARYVGLVRRLFSILLLLSLSTISSVGHAEIFNETPDIEIGPSFCSLYPLVIPHSSVANATLGSPITVEAGTGAGNFAWATWNGSNDVGTLTDSLVPPGNSGNYVDPDDGRSPIAIGAWIQGAPGVMNSQSVRDHFGALLNSNIIVPVWDETRRKGARFDYQVADFAVISPLDYRFSGNGHITFEFVRFTRCYNVRPVAFAQTVETEEDTPVQIVLQAQDADGDALSFDIHMPPTNGTMEGGGQVQNYLPTPGFVGEDSFTFAANDGEQISNIATISIKVHPGITPPIAHDLSLSTISGVPLTLTLLGEHPDPVVLEYHLVSKPNHGVVSGDGADRTYLSAPDFVGTDSFQYIAAYGGKESAPATVTIQVRTNHPPQIISTPPLSVFNGQTLAYSVQAVDSDPDDVIAYSLIEGPANSSIDAIGGLLQWPVSGEFVGHNLLPNLQCASSAGMVERAGYADVVFAVDESGSMSGEHAWLRDFIYGLEAHLASNDVGTSDNINLYGLIGYERVPRPIPVAEDDLGGYQEAVAATSQLRLYGGTEDGYSAMKHGLMVYTLRDGAAKNIVLVTDEDRDVVDSSLTYASMLELFNEQQAILNAVANVRFRCGDGRAALGLGQGGVGFIADGAGGYAVCNNTTATSGSGTTIRDYVDLALATGGAAWDLQYFRSGGLSAMSFSRALTAVKVQEIVESLPPTHLADLALGSARYIDSTLMVDVLNRGLTDFTTTTTLTVTIADQMVASTDIGPLSAGESISVILPLADISSADTIQLQLAGHATESECDVLNNTRSLPWFRVRATDLGGLYDEQTFVVDPLELNRPPVIESEPVTTASVGARYRYDVRASDPDIGDALGFRLLAGPAGMFIDELTGALRFSPSNGQDGQHAITIEVADLHGATATQSFTLDVRDDYLPPRFNSQPWPRATQAEIYRYQTSVNADPSAVLAYYMLHGPDDAAMDAVGGELVWQVPDSFAGRQEIVILQVRDQFGNYDLQMFTLYGDIPNEPPRITTTPGLNATLRSTYSYAPRAQDSNYYEEHSWSLDRHPTGMIITATNGQVSWPSTQVSAPFVQALTLENSLCRLSESGQPFVEARRILQNTGPRAVTQPLVGPLLDDNADGRIDAEDDVAAVYVARGGIGFTGNWIHAVDLRSGKLLWSRNERAPKHQVAPVLVDLGDGSPSIVYLDQSHYLVALDGRGVIRWVSDSPAIPTSLNPANSGIVLADLEGEGRPSLLFGPSVFDADGKLRWQFTSLAGNQTSRAQGMPAAVDLTGDGKPEVVFYNQVRRGDGTLLWQTPSVQDATVYHANFAGADLDGDGRLELVISERTNRGYRLSAVSGAGDLLWMRQGGEVAYAGPVIAADFNGNGAIEIFSPSNMTMFNAAGEPLWSRGDLTRTLFRNALAADLNGDGGLELMVHQGSEIRVLAADTGSVLTRWLWTDNSGSPANQLPVLIRPFGDERSRVVAGGSGGLAMFASAAGPDWPASDTTFNHLDHRAREFTAQHGWLGSSSPVRVLQPAVADGHTAGYRSDLHVSAPVGSVVDGDNLALSVTVRNNGLAAMPAGSEVVLYSDTIAETNRIAVQQLGAMAPRESVKLNFVATPLTELGDVVIAELVPAQSALECTTINHAAASHLATVRVVDIEGAESRQHWALGVIDRNSSPVFNMSLPRNALIGQLYEQSLSASDANLADAVYFRLLAGPDNMTLDPYTGLLHWTPRPEQVGNHSVQINAVDMTGTGITRTATLTAIAPADNRAPTIDSEPSLKATVGVEYLYRVNAADPDDDPVAYELLEAPADMRVHERTGVIRWTPLTDEALEAAVTVRTRDPYGAADQQSFVIRIEGANQPPVIRSLPPLQAEVGALYRYVVDAYDPEGGIVTLMLETSPVGVGWDPADGVLTWTPTLEQIGIQSFAVKARDPQGASTTQTFAVAVNLPANTPPRILSAPHSPALINELYQYQVQAVDEDGDVLSYSLPQSAQGMGIDTEGLLTWLPTTVGGYPVEIRVEDGRGGWATQQFTLEAVDADPDNTAPVITSTPPMIAAIGDPYVYRVQANDPDGDPLTFTLREGPEGMQLDSVEGLLSWTPGTEGAYPVVIRVSDDRAWTEQSYTLSVEQVSPLSVELLIEPAIVDLGETVTIRALVSGGVSPRTTELYINNDLQVLDDNRQTRFVAQQPGRYEVYAQVIDEFERVSALGEFRVRDSEDVTPPVVSIDAPVDGTIITEPVNIIGSVTDLNLVEYRLRVAPARTAQYIDFAIGNHEVINGILGVFDPSMLRNGIYDIQLIATDLGGHESSTKVTYEVAGNLKTGHFTISFDDLMVPLAGLPITVTRTYDTRDRAQALDFGYGWSIGFRSLRLQENMTPGISWQINTYGGIFGQRCVESNGDRIVTITLPDGKQERFIAEVSPRCTSLVATIDVYLVFKPLDGTGATLEQIDYGLLRLANGDLIDLSDPYGPVDPRNYRLTTAEGEVYLIDQNFGVRQITEANGNTVTFSQSGIQHSSGVGINFTRDGAGRIVAITGPDGQPVRYTYDGSGDLVTFSDRGGNETGFFYQSGHYLEEIIDPRGVRAIRNEYDEQGRLIVQIGPDGERIEIERNLAGRTEIIRDARSNATLYLYNERGNVLTETNALGETITRSYDDRDNVLSETDALGNTTHWSYDTRGNKLSETDPLGRTTAFTYNSYNQLLTELRPDGSAGSALVYDNNGNPTRLIDPLGEATALAYGSSGNLTQLTDAAGNVTRYAYDSRGNKVKETAPDGSETTYTYDAMGNVLSESTTRTGADGQLRTLTTTYGYDANGNRIRTTDPLGHTTHTEYNTLGKVSAQVDALGRRTEYEYDARGNQVLTRYPDGSTEQVAFDANGNQVSETDRGGRTTHYTFDAANRLIQTTFPDGSSTQTVYDSAGRVVEEVDAEGHRTLYEYDAAGQRIRVTDAKGHTTRFDYDLLGRVVSETDALGHTTTHEYDAAGRRTRTTYADGSTTVTGYDAVGRKVSQTDQNGHTTRYEYDTLGRLTAVIDALGQRTEYGYDAQGNKISQTDAEGDVQGCTNVAGAGCAGATRITRWAYDDLGRQVSRTLPEGQTETFDYDAVGNRIRHTDFKGQTTTYSYDALNREVSRATADGTTVTTTHTASGQVETVMDASGTTSHAYDTMDRLSQISYPSGQRIEYSYDARGNRITLASGSHSISYRYNALSQLESVTDSDGTTRYIYDALGRQREVRYPNGAVTTTEYDALGRPVKVETKDSVGTVIARTQYTLDAAGHRTRLTETNRTVDYSYDALYRLTQETINDAQGGRRTTWTYDKVGNRLSQSIIPSPLEGEGQGEGEYTTYTYDKNDRLLTETKNGQVTTYGYDANGQTISRSGPDGTVSYTWNHDGRLIAASDSGHTVSYTYDAHGIRQSKTESGVTTRYLVDPNRPYAQVIGEYQNGSEQAWYTHGNDLLSQSRGNTTHYFHSDALGSTRALTDQGGSLSDSYAYLAFGELDASVGTTPNAYLFTGEQYDPALGQYYLRDRYMDPAIGRFTRMDVWDGAQIEPITLHKYAYANLNPIDGIDPSGFMTIAGQMTAISVQSTLSLARAYVFVCAAEFAASSVVTNSSSVFTGCRYRLHRGRIQAQGGSYEDSESWARPTPLSYSEGKRMLEVLVSRMPRRELRARSEGVAKAQIWIDGVARYGGARARVHKTFQGPDFRGGRRVDIDVFEGVAFIP